MRSLSGVDLRTELVVTDLRDFLDRAETELREAIQEYWGQLGRISGESGGCASRPGEIRSEADFLGAVQLNPRICLQYVRLPTPEEVSPDAPHNPSRDGPPAAPYLDTPLRSTLTVLDVLFTFSDEPDWGMDQDLFVVDGYGYGSAPFGIKVGKSSQGPFHMAFFHENSLLPVILPQLRKSFVLERARIFFTLAALSFSKGVDYWGWRFTAWAMHYLQDLTQPYHARAYPPALFPVIWKLLSNPMATNPAKTIGAVLKNHHMLFEALVHFLLNRAVKSRSKDVLIEALIGEGDSYRGTLDAVARDCSRTAARLAPLTDRLLVRLFDDPGIDDHDFFTAEGNMERTRDTILRLIQHKTPQYDQFLGTVGTCLHETGRVTRYAILFGDGWAKD
jgi:hypothetical protein